MIVPTGAEADDGGAAGRRDRIRPPLVVVIVTYNSAEVIEDCLATLPEALEGVRPHRIVVVDNGSTDDTLRRVAATTPGAEIVRLDNRGFASGVNGGLARAQDCDVLVLNPDIRLARGSVGVLRDGLNAAGTGIVVPALFDGTGQLCSTLFRRPTVLRAFAAAVIGGTGAGRLSRLGERINDPSDYRSRRTTDWATGAAWLVSAECVRALGPLDDRYFMYSEETEYMLRAGDRGYRIRYLPEARATHLGGEQHTSPWLYAMSATNRVRLHRERRGRVAAVGMWGAVALNELIRSVRPGKGDRSVHTSALASLVHWRRWPARPAGPAGPECDYLLFAGQDWWYHNRSHSDFQLLRSVARVRRVLVINSIGLRMPTTERSTQVGRRILRKARSVSKLVRRPIPELPRFYVMSPLPFPFYGRRWTRRLGGTLVRAQVRAVCLAIGIRTPVIVATLPTAWDALQPMRRKALVYNRSDRHSAFEESDPTVIRELEQEMLRRADVVLYASRGLLAEEQGLTGSRAHYLDHGVDIEHFVPQDPHQVPADIAAIPRPRLGFFGALDDLVVDFPLLERLADEMPDASLVLIGAATGAVSALAERPNVHVLGFRPYEQIPAYGSAFDVALMPWRDNEWIRHANPIKLKEYLALGLPIVSTGFDEVERYADLVRIARDHDEFIRFVEKTATDGGPADPAARRAAVLDASWQRRAHDLMALVEKD